MTTEEKNTQAPAEDDRWLTEPDPWDMYEKSPSSLDKGEAKPLTAREKREKRLKAALKRKAVESYFLSPTPELTDGDSKKATDTAVEELLKAVEAQKEKAPVATEADYEDEARRLEDAKRHTDGDKDAPADLNLVTLCGPRFARNLAAVIGEYGVDADMFGRLFNDFGSVAPERVAGWLKGTSLPNDGEFRLLQQFLGFDDNHHGYFVRGMLADKDFPLRVRYKQRLSESKRFGETLQGALLAPNRIGLSNYDRSLLLQIAQTLQKSAPLEIAEKIVAQRREIDDLKGCVRWLGEESAKEKERLNKVIGYLNERNRRFRKYAGVAAFACMVVIGLWAAITTSGLGKSDVPAAAAPTAAQATATNSAETQP